MKSYINRYNIKTTMRITNLFVFIFCFSGLTKVVSAQPGGGGGLVISNLFNRELNKIELTDSLLTIRGFVMKSDSRYSKVYYENYGIVNNRRYGYDGIYLPPDYNNYLTGNNFDNDNQRLLIIYKADTMMIDFSGIMNENGAGFSDSMDSIVIQKGHYRHIRNPYKGNGNLYERKHMELLRYGITPNTIKELKRQKWMVEQEKIDLSFLKEKHLPAFFILQRGKNFVSQKNYEKAIDDMLRVLKMSNKSSVVKEALHELSDLYSVSNPALALKYLNKLLRKEKNESLYKDRIDLYIKTNQLQKALRDYDKLAGMGNHYLNNNQRAIFKADYLKDFDGATNDLMKIINSIHEDHLSGCPDCQSEYGSTYFTLGLVEYKKNDFKNAFSHLLKAMEIGYEAQSSDRIVVCFDSLIDQHPNAEELYFARAIAVYKRAPFAGSWALSVPYYTNALNDLIKAENFGYNKPYISIFHASLLLQLKREHEALEKINSAIEKNNNDPRAYQVRYEIRGKLGQTIWGDTTDKDWVTFSELGKSWKFDK